MDRRKAIGGILGLAGVGLGSVLGAKYFFGNASSILKDPEEYLELLGELVDVIIPPTTSPGAKESLVQNYIIYYMKDCATKKEYHNFFNGLNNLQETCLNDYNNNFETCSMKQKIEVLEDLDNGFDAGSLLTKINNKIRGRSFFEILKSLTIEGYCTSELGATEFLEYVPTPGEYIAITRMKPNQKAWATR